MNSKNTKTCATIQTPDRLNEMVYLLRNGFKMGKGFQKDAIELEIQSDGLVVTDKFGSFSHFASGDWVIGIADMTIGEDGVTVNIDGCGPVIYKQTLESEEERDYMEAEVKYSYEDLDLPEDFEELCMQDQIESLIELTTIQLKNQY